MSAIYNEFKNMDSETAFLVGVVSTLSDQTLCRIIPRYWAVEADVFKTDMEHLLTTVKSRLTHYFRGDDYRLLELIENLKFEVELSEINFEQILHSLFDSYKANHSSEESKYIKEFLDVIRFQIGDIEAIYRLTKPLGEKSSRCFSEFYTYIVFDIIFIKYTDYVVMVVLGSDE